MNQAIFQFLKNYGSDEYTVNRLLVSSFIVNNKISVIKNKAIKRLLIKNDELEYSILIQLINLIQKSNVKYDFESLLELFEFVISPLDKLVNGAVYTPKYIRDYITEKAFEHHNKNKSHFKVSDIACGCGGFLINATEKIKQETNKSFKNIFNENIFGLDIQDYSVERTKILLSLFAIYHGEDEEEFSFNIYQGNSLLFDWKNADIQVKNNNGFDIILGNPPYVCSRNMDNETKELLENWQVCSTGHPDLYIPFFQIGYELLADEGILGYITVNTFIRSVNGRALRNYFVNNRIGLKIIDFEGEQVFKSRVTYTCLAFLTKDTSESLQYLKHDSTQLSNVLEFKSYLYSSLDHFQGWSLKNAIFVQKCETMGERFSSIYNTRSGIATLKNSAYIFTPSHEDQHFYYINQTIPIEKSICRDIVNSNLLVRESTLENIKEKIIFPYLYEDGIYPKVIDEQYFVDTFPKAYNYLNSHREVLAQRDKGKGKNYPNWYAFGRTQSMEKAKYKLFFPQLAKECFNSCISEDEDLYFYNGMAAYSSDLLALKVLQKIFQTDIFWEYVRNVSKNYNSNYYSLGKNFIKNFGIPDLSHFDKEYIINLSDRTEINKFFTLKYSL